MKTETIIDAMIRAHGMRFGINSKRRNRQYYKFRARLIQKDKTQSAAIELIQILTCIGKR